MGSINKDVFLKLKIFLFKHVPENSIFWKLNILLYNRFFRNRQYMYFHHKNILLEDFKAIYFFIPKVACSTLKKICAESLGYILHKDNIDQNIHLIDYPYAPLNEIYTTYKHYFKFAFVRNPWDRLVSCYLNKIGPSSIHGNFSKYGLFYPDMSFENFVKAVAIIPDIVSDEHFRSQASFLWDIHGEQRVDFIGKLESIDKDFGIVGKRLNMPVDKLPHLMRSRKRKLDYRNYYTNETIALVANRYRKDIELLGYTF